MCLIGKKVKNISSRHLHNLKLVNSRSCQDEEKNGKECTKIQNSCAGRAEAFFCLLSIFLASRGKFLNVCGHRETQAELGQLSIQ